MPINTILTNTGASYISNGMANARDRSNLAQMQLASGLKAPDPAVDPAGSAIGAQRQNDIDIAQTVQNTVVQGGSLMALGVGVLQSISNILSRMSNLAIQATSATLDDDSRVQLNEEFQQLLSQIDLNAQTTWGSQTLFGNGPGNSISGNMQVGLDSNALMAFSFTDMTATGLNIDSGANIADASGAQTTYGKLKDALTKTLDELAGVAAYKSRLDAVDETMTILIQGLEVTKSTYVDADIPQSLIEANQAQALFNAGSSALQQNLQLFSRLAQLIQSSLNN